jgi:hypothetical protein
MNQGAQVRVAETWWWELAEVAQVAGVVPRKRGREHGTPQGTLTADNVLAKKQGQSKKPGRGAGEPSGPTARRAGRRRTIRQNVNSD